MPHPNHIVIILLPGQGPQANIDPLTQDDIPNVYRLPPKNWGQKVKFFIAYSSWVLFGDSFPPLCGELNIPVSCTLIVEVGNTTEAGSVRSLPGIFPLDKGIWLIMLFSYLLVMWRKIWVQEERIRKRKQGRDIDMEMEIEVKSEPHLKFCLNQCAATSGSPGDIPELPCNIYD